MATTVAFGLALSACGSGSVGNAPQAANTTGPAPKGVTLTLWHNTADSTALTNLYKAYEKASGNKISFVDIPPATFPMTVQSKWATGARPDILEWNGNRMDLLALNGAKNMIDLSGLPFVKKEGTLATTSGGLNGKTYAATLGMPSVFGVFYNKKVLTAAGLQPPTSYGDLAGMCATLKSKASGVAPIYESGGSGWSPAVLSGFDYMGQYNKDNAYSQSIVDKKATLNDPKGPFVAGLRAYDSLRTTHCFNSDASTASWENSLKALVNGKAAMVASSTDSIGMLNGFAGGDTKKVDDTIGFVGLSATTSTANYAPTPLGTYYVPKTGNSKKERAAVDFIQWITGAGYADYVKESKAPPTLSGTATPEVQQLLSTAYDAYQGGATLTINSIVPGFGTFGTEADKLLAGQQSPQDVADKMQKYFLQASAASSQ
ncbi:ABC transporter substrate-binding protein [Streptomyces sp. MBT62]|uniref:ABC transporter substrate-binding protein n=1 Tax=Streptomyces sp. MBT62 TaxID=2800410 RepID=UPI00190A6068|nr:extracellular solute-binding protein [Streptomyces sp. MBT62]MBK3565214.1 extracellular solute-binding protein [Streptomyces sp. MBT62]